MRLSHALASAATMVVTATIASGETMPLRRREGKSNPAPMTGTEYGVIYDVDIQFGNQSFVLLVDTGSSDTWVVRTGFRCIDKADNAELPPEDCRYANTYNLTDTFTPVDNQTFGVQYGTGIAMGIVGHEDVTLAGITVRGQTVGIVDSITDVGDDLISGILGLGYPPLTSAHPGSNFDNDSLLLDRARYDPLHVTMHKRGLIEAWFSLAIERLDVDAATGPGGYLGLGELPPVSYDDHWAVAPVEVTEAIPLELTAGVREITFWTLTVEGVSWGPAGDALDDDAGVSRNATAFQAVVDSGNPMNMFPPELASKINAAFDPAGKFDEETQTYVVECDARPPRVGVTIDGRTFWHRGEDLVIRQADGSCYSSLTPTGEGDGIQLNFLGDAFLKNVVAVFDFGKDEMRYAARLDDSNVRGNGTGNGNGAGPASGTVPASGAAGWSIKYLVVLALAAALFL